MIRKIVAIVTGFALASGWVTAQAQQQAAPPPNVIFIMVDDMGHSDLSLTGSHHISTPNIDSIAHDGLWLQQGYSSTPICSPTRTALLTGNYAQRYWLGVEEPLGPNTDHWAIPEGTTTIASVFQDRGYYTALIGKWHLGDPPVSGPLQHGYDDFFGIVEGAADYFRHRMVVGGREVGMGLSRGNEPIDAEGYLTDMFGSEAIAAIDRADGRPFFISLHFNAPHWPWEGREDQAVSEMIDEATDQQGGSIEKYRELLEIADENVGLVLAALEERGLADNTIVIFTSDNGAERFSETWPFIGYKGEVLEGGVRVPILMRWPGHIAPESTSQQVMASMDFLPTLLSMSGGDVESAGSFDGMDLSGQLLGRDDPVERELYFRFNAGRQAALRHGDWKYVSIGGNEYLFNLAEDQRERADRSQAEPEIFNRLRNMWDAWNLEMRPYRIDGQTESLESNRSYADRY